MAYGEDWTSILTPILRGVESGAGFSSSFDELPWLEDEQELDPFTTEFDREVARFTGGAGVTAGNVRRSSLDTPTAVRAREGGFATQLGKITLPAAPSRGIAKADMIAASKGVDPGSKGGVGKMLDLARTQIGVPYVFGAYDAGNAFDCSGFVKWLYSRSMGVALPHSSTAQADSLEKVARKDLQPGDLVFFSYGRLGQGVIDHVEVYMGDGKMIGTANQTDDLDIDNVDWSNFVQGGRAASMPDVGNAPLPKKLQEGPVTTQVVKRKPVEHIQTLAPMALSSGAPAFASVMDSLFAPDSVPFVTEKTLNSKRGGSVDQQLRKGFIDAGRPDLARMVGTKDFRTWLNQESGYDPTRVSQPYDGIRNYGMFQFRGHDWQNAFIDGATATDGRAGTWTASAYEQAKLVAKYFGHLTPGAIHTYADQIRAGDYHGWG